MAALTLLVTGGAVAAAEQTVYLAGRGEILRATLGEDGSLSEPVVVGRGESGMLAASPDGRFLYATGARGGEGPTGTVGAYRIEDDGTLSHLGSRDTEGRTACFVTVDRSGRHVFVANFRHDDQHSRGSVVRLPVADDGSLEPVAWRAEHAGSGANHPRQAASHPHSVVVSPDNTLVAVGDLGIDRVVVYRFEAESGSLRRINEDGFVAPPGSGPRHLAFHPHLPLLSVINESGGTVSSFALDEARFGERLQTIATGGGACADLHLHPSGRFLFGSNRGGRGIVCYAIAPDTGVLDTIDHDHGGDGPRELEPSPDGRFLLAVHSGSDRLEVLRIDPASGHLTAIDSELTVAGLSSALCLPPRD